MRASATLVTLLFAACTGTIDNGNGQGGPDAGTPPPSADAPPIIERVAVAGVVQEYFSETPTAATVTADLTPPVTSEAGDDGRYSVQVPTGTPFGLSASKPGLRPTHNGLITATGPLAAQTLFVTSNQRTSQQYAGLGLQIRPDTSVIFFPLVDSAGAPLLNLNRNTITLVNAENALVPNTRGPYYFGAAGNLVNNINNSSNALFGGKVRVGFLDCPVGNYKVRVNTALGGGPFELPVTCTANGAVVGVPKPVAAPPPP